MSNASSPTLAMIFDTLLFAINGAFSQRVLKNSPNHLEQPSVLPIPTEATAPNAVELNLVDHEITDDLSAIPTAPIPGRASAAAAIKSLIPNIKLPIPSTNLAPPLIIFGIPCASLIDLPESITFTTPS